MFDIHYVKGSTVCEFSISSSFFNKISYRLSNNPNNYLAINDKKLVTNFDTPIEKTSFTITVEADINGYKVSQIVGKLSLSLY